jgi:hypothetical protein
MREEEKVAPLFRQKFESESIVHEVFLGPDLQKLKNSREYAILLRKRKGRQWASAFIQKSEDGLVMLQLSHLGEES